MAPRLPPMKRSNSSPAASRRSSSGSVMRRSRGSRRRPRGAPAARRRHRDHGRLRSSPHGGAGARTRPGAAHEGVYGSKSRSATTTSPAARPWSASWPCRSRSARISMVPRRWPGRSMRRLRFRYAGRRAHRRRHRLAAGRRRRRIARCRIVVAPDARDERPSAGGDTDRPLARICRLADAILAEPLAIIDGRATATAKPGTGLAWNDEAVMRYRLA